MGSGGWVGANWGRASRVGTGWGDRRSSLGLVRGGNVQILPCSFPAIRYLEGLR